MRTLLFFAGILLVPGFNNARPDEFLMPVDDFFSMPGRGIVVTGVIERGKIRVGDSVDFVGFSHNLLKAKVSGIESGGKMLKEATKGQQAGLIISGIDKSSIERGMVICQPGSVKAYSVFSCQIKLLTKAEGGSSNAVSDKGRVLFQVWNATVSGEVSFLVGDGKLQPGDSAHVLVKLVNPVAMENDLEFTIKEGGKTVGKGKIVKVVK